jgi:anti-anti-sigma regulatory factor
VRVPGVGRVDIDGGRLDFVDSAGVHALLRSRASAWHAGVQWFLGPRSTALRRVLDLTRIGSLHDSSMN